MLRPHLAVRINETSAFATGKNLALLLSKKLIAIGAFVEVILFFLQQKFELLHEEATDDFVFALLEDVQTVEAHFLSHLTDDVGIDAGHVDLHA